MPGVLVKIVKSSFNTAACMCADTLFNSKCVYLIKLHVSL